MVGLLGYRISRDRFPDKQGLESLLRSQVKAGVEYNVWIVHQGRRTPLEYADLPDGAFEVSVELKADAGKCR